MPDAKPDSVSSSASGSIPDYKFSPPGSPIAAISRPRLSSEILTHTHYSTVVIQGPAGHGKTTLLQQLLESLREDGGITGWLTLEPNDNDVSRFNACLRKLIASATREPEPGTAMPPAESGGDSSVDNILRLLNSFSQRVALFLDEFQYITDPLNISLLESVIERVPPHVTFYIASRSIPDMARGKLFVSGQLKWVTPQDLCFTTEEVLAFLNAYDLEVEFAEAEEFRDQTGGWPATLRLLQLALSGNSTQRYTPLVWVKTCREDLKDYLAGNVMRDQSEPKKVFLLHTSLLNRLNAPLCELITGETDSADILHEMVSLGLFLTPVDETRNWFKYHSLFRDYLRGQLKRTNPAKVVEIHLTAADWFRNHHHFDDAFYHAKEAGSHDLALDILEEWIPELIQNAQLQTVDQLCETLPIDVFSSDPSRCWKRIWAQFFLHKYEAAHNNLERLEKSLSQGGGPPEDLAVSIDILKCTEAMVTEDFETFNTLADQIDVDLGEISKFRCFEMNALANIKAIRGLGAGRFTEAREWALIGESLGERSNAAFSAAYSTSLLAYAMIQDGHLQQAITNLRQALGRETLKIQGSFASASLSAIYGFALYESGNFIDAASHLSDSIDVISLTLPLGWLIPAYISLARASASVEDNYQNCMELLDQAERVGLVNRHPRMAIAIRRERIRIALLTGNLEEARSIHDIPDLAEEGSLPQGWLYLEEGCDDELICEARLAIYAGRSADALEQLTPGLEATEAKGWVRRRIKLLILAAIAHHELEDTSTARRLLSTALTLAAPDGYLACFIDEGQRCMDLVSSLLDQAQITQSTQVHNLMSKILQQAGYTQGVSSDRDHQALAIEQLTKREFDILQQVVNGASNKEIADNLFVSYNTVKFHMKNLYAKVGAKNRVNLTQIARTMALLPPS